MGHGPGHPNCAFKLPALAPAPALPGMPLQLPYLSVTATWTMSSCSQDCCNEAMQAMQPVHGCSCGRREQKSPEDACAPLLQMAVDVGPASLMLWPTACFYIRGACLGHAGLDRTAHSLAGFDQRSQTHAAIGTCLRASPRARVCCS